MICLCLENLKDEEEEASYIQFHPHKAWTPKERNIYFKKEKKKCQGDQPS